jgi:hypothetical protein
MDKLATMAYTSESARRQLLDELGQAADRLSSAINALGDAYEAADEGTAEVIEAQLFRPVQGAYGRAQRTRSGFADRHELSAEPLTPATAAAPSADPRVHLERAATAIEQADQVIAEMQDSMLPVEVGDREFRDGLAEVRELIAPAPSEARRLLGRIGR